jgi:hypothetical protein
MRRCDIARQSIRRDIFSLEDVDLDVAHSQPTAVFGSRMGLHASQDASMLQQEERLQREQSG